MKIASNRRSTMTARRASPGRPLHASALLCVSLVLSGCMVGPNFVRPDSGSHAIELTPRPDYGDAARTSAADVPERWWTLFDDARLDELQLRAQAGNPDLQIASARIDEARARLRIASSGLLPTLAGGASHSREALSEHGKLAALGAPTAPGDFWQLGFDASWEIGLWGRARRVREGAEATLEGTVYDREAARVALSAEVARIYLQLRGTQAGLSIAEQNRTIAERVLGLTESRARNGVATRFETASARARLATVKALVPDLIQRRNLQMNALARLLGAPPRALDEQLRDAMPLPTLPSGVPAGVPSELAHRRPDILRAEAQLHAATAAIGVAKADFYPRIGLKGRVGVEAFESGDLASWDSRFFSVGPTVYLPIFQGGRLAGRLALSRAREKAAAIEYRQTVLHAWHEVDDALDAWAARRRQHAELEVSHAQNREALRASERGYQEGAVDYLAVLTAQREVLASQTRLVDNATSATLALVNLYKSLGGGWHPAGSAPAATFRTTVPAPGDRQGRAAAFARASDPGGTEP